MFKKLKDKIAEEVKSSPQRIQQLTQSVTDRIHNATSDESFFSIGDDDASSPNPEPGFSNVSLSSYTTPNSGRIRRSSNSSVASDMSFLPRYESASNLYHLQSDLDISASEVEDNASTSSSQLGHLSKEQIYAAFQKSQMRYHKYRGRYTDIANHYKELERENGKMKSVLVETQDKALRRVAELREQCSLEQKAKAHLENALRVELDEKQYVIDTLKTKVNLLQGESKPAELLLNISDNPFSISDEKPNDDNLDILTKDLKDARIEIENLNEKLQEMKANTIIFGSKEADFKKKILDLEEIIKQRTQDKVEVLERERENNLIIAQTKMELHTEIQNRDLEIENLKQDVEALKSDLEEYESKPKISKMENLQSQNTKLIEKVEELMQKCNNYENEMLKTEQLRIEIQNLNKIIESFKVKIQELEEEKLLQEKLEEEVLGHKQINEALQVDLKNLEEQLKKQQSDSETNFDAYREDTKQHLLTLETKIKDKIKLEYEEKQEKLNLDFQEKLQQLSKTDNNVKETQIKLMEKQEQVKNLEKNITTLQINLEAQLNKYKDLETNHLELISESAEVRNKIVRLEKENSELTKVINSTKQELEDFKHRQQNEISTLKELQKQTAALTIENAALRSDSVNSSDYETLQNQNISLQEKIIALQSKLVDLENRVLELSGSNAKLTGDKEELINNNEELMRKNITVAEEKSKLEKEYLHASSRDKEECLGLQERLQEFTKTIETLQSEINEKQKEVDLLQEKLSSTEGESNQNETELADLKQKLKDSEGIKQNLNKKIKEQKTKFHEEIQNLNKEVLSFKEHNKMIQVSIEEYKQKLSEYEAGSLEKTSHLEELSNANVVLQTELENSKILLENSKIASKNFESELSEKQLKIQTLHEENSSLNTKLQKFIDENSNLKEKISTSSITTTEIQSSNENLHEEIKTYITKLNSLSEENNKLKEEISRLKELEVQISKLQDMEADYKALQKQKLELVGAVEELQTKTQESNMENRRLQEEIARSQKQEMDYLKENQETKENHTKVLEEISELQRRNNELSLDYNQVTQENEGLLQELVEVKLKYETLDSEKTKWEETIQTFESEKTQIQNELQLCKTEIDQLKSDKSKPKELQDMEKLESENKSLKVQLNRLEEHYESYEKQKKNLEVQLRELEHQYSEITHEKQLLQDEVQELKISPINMNNHNAEKLENLDIIHAQKIYALETPNDVQQLQETHEKEINNLNEKLIQYKSLDLTNRSSIQFYENELQKLKNKNEKLNRKLDETLVTLNHCTELSTSTETEYLKNVLYNYMLGKEGVVLARVIAAVCKFDDNQTEAILQREQQKQTLLGQLGFR